MNPTIADLRIRHVFAPPLESYSAPHAPVKIPCQQSYDQGWNAAVAFYKELGKI